MYRIRIFSSFCDSTWCKLLYEQLCEVYKMDNYGPNKTIYIVSEDEPFTHAILINTAMPELNIDIPKHNIIGFAFEPPQVLFNINNKQFNEYLKYVNKYVNKYYIGNTSGLPSAFIQSYSYMWHITPPTNIPPDKTKLISIIISNQLSAPGDKYIHKMVKNILQTNYPIDIYGRGGCYYNNDDVRIKGEFTENEPYENYVFHICVETFQTNSYTSEKYTTPLLWGTLPIYWGARNPPFPDLTIELIGDISKDMDIITNIVNNPMKFKKHFSQEEIRNKLNMLKNLDTIFSI